MEFNKPFAMMDSEEDKMINVENVNEGYEVNSENVWEVFDKLAYEIGSDELLLNIAKSLGTDKLSNVLFDIARTFGIDTDSEFTEDNFEDEFDDDYTGVKPF